MKKNEYSKILIEEYFEGIKFFHELDNNNFIFSNVINYIFNMCFPSHNEIIITKIKLKGPTNNEKENILKQVDKDYYGNDNEPNTYTKRKCKKSN